MEKHHIVLKFHFCSQESITFFVLITVLEIICSVPNQVLDVCGSLPKVLSVGMDADRVPFVPHIARPEPILGRKQSSRIRKMAHSSKRALQKGTEIHLDGYTGFGSELAHTQRIQSTTRGAQVPPHPFMWMCLKSYCIASAL